VPTARLGIAIDAGGTKTTACIAQVDQDGSAVVLSQATSGAANPAAVGLEQTKTNIETAIRDALAIADAAESPVQRLIAGLAGIEATGSHDELAEWAKATFRAERAAFVTDVELLHFAGRQTLPAIVLISGTGSVAFGRDAGGNTARTGGRGYLMGDEGSGFWIGQRGLQAAVRALDHAAPSTALVSLLAESLGSVHADVWTREIYAAADPREKIAQMSHRVADAAAQGDGVAIQILDDAGRELAHLVRCVAEQLSLAGRPFDLVLAGGILVGVGDVKAALDRHLQSLAMPIENQRVIENPAVEAAKRCVETVGGRQRES
jgi:N-acetylglucosamine kinase-like BadF-type ATPase